MRGQPKACCNVIFLPRIIPARAGPTRTPITAITNVRDHPRSCGANTVFQREDGQGLGSSPLVRGQHQGAGRQGRQRRIIPARAGPTALMMRWVISCPDHPRSCGANEPSQGFMRRLVGSSPLVRGQLGGGEERRAWPRIIPARAGPTIQCLHGLHLWTDHPRSCGANLVQYS